MHDIHATLLHIGCKCKRNAEGCSYRGHGRDLLGESVPENRSCAEAGIPPKYCPYQGKNLDDETMSILSPLLLAAWTAYVNALVNANVFFGMCESLAPSRFEVVNVRSHSHNLRVIQHEEYSVQIRLRSNVKTGFYLDAGFDGTRWTIHHAIRSSSYAHERCHQHSAVLQPIRELCFCRR